MNAIVIAIVGMSLTIIGLIVKLTIFSTEIRMWVMDMQKKMPILSHIPHLEWRVSTLEKHCDISSPSMSNTEQ